MNIVVFLLSFGKYLKTMFDNYWNKAFFYYCNKIYSYLLSYSVYTFMSHNENKISNWKLIIKMDFSDEDFLLSGGNVQMTSGKTIVQVQDGSIMFYQE